MFAATVGKIGKNKYNGDLVGGEERRERGRKEGGRGRERGEGGREGERGRRGERGGRERGR